eukprot:g5360.t1
MDASCGVGGGGGGGEDGGGGGVEGGAGGEDAEEDVDVIFYGTVNAYRAQALERLRTAGLSVLLANPDGDVLQGGPLLRDIRRARLVLNLRYGDADREWKLTRLLPLLVNRQCVLSEECGHWRERARFAAGLVFAHGGGGGGGGGGVHAHAGRHDRHADLVRQAVWYASPTRAAARRAVASMGCAIARDLREEDVLARALAPGPGPTAPISSVR